ncbi:NAD-dependent epimerase/dehydratase family protein [Mesorhizobium sp. M0833]|uniref:NAD-dependent epimerase/dehydratase family protein n=1 Tax=Mesorhizobium sp. M0833 TaxID=2957009 RepID=UPI00333CBA6D
MSSYLITGGAGFIGSHLCDVLLDRDDRVVVLDNFLSGKRQNLPTAHPNIRVLNGDIREIAKFRSEIGDVDAIVHLAALISGYDSLRTPDEYVGVNVTGLQRVIDFAATQRIRRIVFASSSTVYGNTDLPSIDESVTPAPVTVYAASKLFGEHLLAMYANLHGYSYCSLRLFNVYGPRQAVDHPYANVTCKFSHAAAHGLPIKKFGDGGQSRDFVYIADVVDAFISVLEERGNGLYNIGTGTSNSINTLISELEEITNSTLGVELLDPWPNDIRRIQADVSKYITTFGRRPKVSLREGLERTVDFFRG